MTEAPEPTDENTPDTVTEPEAVTEQESEATSEDTSVESVADEQPELIQEQTEETTSGNATEPESADTPDDSQLDNLENVEFPEASFDMLLMHHHTQAMLALGLIPDPATGQVIKNKSAAKFHIDMLAIIQERTEGNLNDGEAEALNGVLHNLRMMFVNNS